MVRRIFILLAIFAGIDWQCLAAYAQTPAPPPNPVFEKSEASTFKNADDVVKKTCARLGGSWTGDHCVYSSSAGVTSKKHPCEEAGGKWDAASGQCSKHPWYDGNPDGEADWYKDSIEVISDFGRFYDCMQPDMILPFCPYCIPAMLPDIYLDDECEKPYVNPGMVFEYWWPEAEIEINNFAISDVNPVTKGKVAYARTLLEQGIENLFKTKDLQPYLTRLGTDPLHPADYLTKLNDLLNSTAWKNLRKDPNLGQSALQPTTPGDQGYYSEAHIYSTELQSRLAGKRQEGKGYYDIVYIDIEDICIPATIMLFNGYRKGNPDNCFYDTLDPKGDDIKAWTEDTKYAKYWRIPEKSKDINGKFYAADVPFDTTSIHGIADFREQVLKHTQYPMERSCDSYRLEEWDERYGELIHAGVQKVSSDVDPELKDALARSCYYGGGELYPLVGGLLGVYTESPASAYISRRAIELAGQVSHKHLENRPANKTKQPDDKFRNHCGGEDHVNRFTRFIDIEDEEENRNRETDKLQRIYPDVTECFNMNQVDERDHELFPADLMKPENHGSIRYIYWNRRQACACDLRGAVSSPERDNGNSTEDGLPYGWGCLPYPYDNYDVGRGNVEEANIEGMGIPAIVPLCTYPYVGGYSFCEENAGTMEMDANQGSERPCKNNKAAENYLGLPDFETPNFKAYTFDYEWDKTWENSEDYIPPARK